MSKRIEIDGEYYRVRRGVLVKIPKEWVGKVPTKQTISNRNSKLTNKLARSTKWRVNRFGSTGYQYLEYKDKKLDGGIY